LLRAKLQRYAHAAAAIIAGGILPILATYGFLRWYSVNHAIPGSWWLTGLTLLTLVVLMAHSVAKCSVGYPLLGIIGIGLAAFMPKGLGYAVFFVGLSLMIGLAIAHAAYRALRSRVSEPEACKTSESPNPRCGTCHARSFCPYQPGGFADRYTFKK